MSRFIEFFSADEVRELLTFETAIDAIERALRTGLDPEADGPRLFADAPGGEFLLMPAQSPDFAGVKVITVAPENPARGLEKIQGLYVLVASDTLAPLAVMEGSCLTAIRTPSVALTAVRQLARLAPAGADPGADPRILIFGAGTQAAASVQAALVDFPNARFEVVGRRPERLVAMLAGLAADPATAHVRVDAAADVEAAVAAADIILTTTTATSAIFDGSLVKENAIVAATGTHGLDARELDDALVSRADIVVEGRASARAESGNLATALDDEAWEQRPPANLQDLVQGRFTRTPGRPAVYTGVGMSWEDLVCASAVYTAHTGERP